MSPWMDAIAHDMAKLFDGTDEMLLTYLAAKPGRNTWINAPELPPEFRRKLVAFEDLELVVARGPYWFITPDGQRVAKAVRDRRRARQLTGTDKKFLRDCGILPEGDIAGV